MADRRERELMLGIFLMEAWDTAGALEEGLGQLAGDDAPSTEALAPLVVLAHRLKGSAALYGFPGVSTWPGPPSGCCGGRRAPRPRSGRAEPRS